MNTNKNNSPSFFPPGFKKTSNEYGISLETPGGLMNDFIDFLDPKKHAKAMDIGAAYGVTTLPALKKGIHVIANDLSQEHLDAIAQQCSKPQRDRLTLMAGRFPEELSIEKESLDVILASQVFHFLKGEDIEIGIKKIYQWLKPGGHLFAQMTTPYTASVKKFTPIYEKRKAKGERWPGYVNNIHSYLSFKFPAGIPNALHLLEPDTIKPSMEEAGFTILKCVLNRTEDVPEFIWSDGRENFQLIAQKPMD